MEAKKPYNPKTLAGLAPREVEVANLVAEGLSNEKIAIRLNIQTQSVKNYLVKILDKLGLENRVQLAILAANLKGGKL